MSMLELDPEAMRLLGHRAVDAVIDHWAGLGNRPAARVASRAQTQALLHEPVPRAGTDPGAVLDRILRDVMPNAMYPAHPKFFAWIPGPSNFVSVIADLLASGYGVYPDLWIEAAGPTQIELTAIDWLRELVGLPETAGGLFTSGGSKANLTGLAVARHARLGEDFGSGTVYLSTQTHTSVTRALRILGIAEARVRHIGVDADWRIDLAELEAAIEADRAQGLRPFCLVGNAGTTNTGAVDPLAQLAALAKREGLWLHVDGAYGAAAILSDSCHALLEGLDQADSIAIDPHKWLFQPLEIGGLLVREARLLRETFHTTPEYLQDSHGELEEVNLSDYGVQLTRGFRALKFWMSLQVFGLDAFRAAVDRGLALGQLAERTLREHGWEIVTPASLAILNFRFPAGARTADEEDRLQRAIVEAVMQDGEMMIGSTRLAGRTVLRMCTINPRLGDRELRDCIERLTRIAETVSDADGSVSPDGDPGE